MNAVTLRPAHPADAAAIAQVRVDSWRTTYRGLIPDAYLDRNEGRGQHGAVGRVLTRRTEHDHTFVAEHDGQRRRFRRPGNAGGAEARYRLPNSLRSTCVPTAQRAGIGRRLVGAVAAAQRAHGATGLIVWVIAGNKPARAFYEALGGDQLIEQPFPVGRHGPGRSWLRLARPAGADRAPHARQPAMIIDSIRNKPENRQ